MILPLKYFYATRMQVLIVKMISISIYCVRIYVYEEYSGSMNHFYSQFLRYTYNHFTMNLTSTTVFQLILYRKKLLNLHFLLPLFGNDCSFLIRRSSRTSCVNRLFRHNIRIFSRGWFRSLAFISCAIHNRRFLDRNSSWCGRISDRRLNRFGVL